jgi:parallel beta-helix repeat protein
MKAILNRQKASLAIIAIALFAGLSGQSSQAATVDVGTCVPGVTSYSTITAAIGNPKATTIRVCPGNYPEQVVIKRNLTLTGISADNGDNPVLVVPSAGFVANTNSLTNGSPIAAQILVQSPATEVTISDLAVDGSGNNLNSGCSEPPLIGIYYRGVSGTVNYVAARNQAQNATNFGCADSAGLGIFVESGNSEDSTVTIKNSTVRGYQKNGITANEAGTTITLNGNSLVGAGPVGIAQNGIQVAYGATGTVEDNTIADDDTTVAGTAAAGILVYGSERLSITGNSIANTQTGIVTVTAGSLKANGNTVSNNLVADTHLGDGIDLCSDSNTVTGNTVFSSDESGIHLDSTCGSTGASNNVSSNAVNDACAGILVGGTGNTIATSNTFANVTNLTLNGDVCPVAASSVMATSEAVSQPGRTFSPVRP